MALKVLSFQALCFLLLCNWVIEAVRFHSFAGPYVMYAEKIYRCSGVDYSKHIGFVNLRPSFYRPHYKSLQTITGNASILKEIGDDHKIYLRSDIWSSNSWKENALLFKFPGGACSTSVEHAPFMWNLLKKDIHDSRRCPASKGFWTFDHIPLNLSFPKFPVLPYGRYRTTFSVGLKEIADSFCIVIDTVIAQNPRHP